MFLDEVGKDGQTLRETLKVVEEKEGYTPQELLDEPDCPAGFDYIWRWFRRLNSCRPSGFGIGAITETELMAFFRNRKIEPSEWEIDLLLRLDQRVLAKAAEKAKKGKS